MGLFDIFKRGLEKTRTAIVRSIKSLFSDIKSWDDASYAKLEQALVSTDLGYAVSHEIVEDLKDRYKRGLIDTEVDIIKAAKERLLAIITEGGEPGFNFPAEGPAVILMVGVNGSGKTTTTAKLARYYMKQGKSVMLGAGDTFRAAGSEQLRIWAERLECPVVTGKTGGDAASVAFDAVKSGIVKKCDYVLIDTAGRQHTRKDLMDELSKIKRVLAKAMPDAPHEVWLTVDASTGSNALIQAREFGKIFPISGLLLTKLDGTGKGGIAVAIKRELGYPVRFVGLGEQMDDLQQFDPQSYAEALFS
ncbi:MAG: signal recognition particle-docking protein FtsY [Victivallales bacterium]|nr:signal recognition particle-docking protein FtsY [Victivallales bacterium]